METRLNQDIEMMNRHVSKALEAFSNIKIREPKGLNVNADVKLNEDGTIDLEGLRTVIDTEFGNNADTAYNLLSQRRDIDNINSIYDLYVKSKLFNDVETNFNSRIGEVSNDGTIKLLANNDGERDVEIKVERTDNPNEIILVDDRTKAEINVSIDNEGSFVANIKNMTDIDTLSKLFRKNGNASSILPSYMKLNDDVKIPLNRQELVTIQKDGLSNYIQSLDTLKTQNVAQTTSNGEVKDISSKYEYTDDFRRLQEESRNLYSTISQQQRSDSFDGELRTRVERVLRRELGDFYSRNTNTPRLLNNTGDFKITTNVDGSLFHDVFEIVRTYLKNGELVDLHDNYNNVDCYLSDDGLSGFAIEKNGNLVSVFNLSQKKGFLRAISNEIKSKAKMLDCYVSPKQNLQGMYEAKFGFKTASIMDYNMDYDHDNIAQNHNYPKVAFMVNTDKDITLKHFNKDQYDEAQAYQMSFVKGRKVLYDVEINHESDLISNMERAIDENDTNVNFKIEINNIRDDIVEHLGLNKKLTFNFKSAKLIANINEHKLSVDEIKKIIYESFESPDYIFYSNKNDSFAFVVRNLNMATILDLNNLVIKSIFKNSRGESYFDNIQQGKNSDKIMVYNKNEEACWASIATSAPRVNEIISDNKRLVNATNENNSELVVKSSTNGDNTNSIKSSIDQIVTIAPMRYSNVDNEKSNDSNSIKLT